LVVFGRRRFFWFFVWFFRVRRARPAVHPAVVRAALFNDAMVRLLVLVLGLLGPHWPNAVSANWM
jgi:hypothetical protein